MLEQLLVVDKCISLSINGWNNPFFDQFFLEATHRFTWIPLYLALLWFLFRQNGWSCWKPIVVIAAMIALSDQISSFVFKPLVERLRPCDEPSISNFVHIVNGYKAGGYSFFSSHASNCASLLTFVVLISRNKIVGGVLLLWTFINAYSRIYLGVHYMSDVLFGLVFGVLLGIGGFYLYKKLFASVIYRSKSIDNAIVISVFMCTITYLLISKSII